MFEQAVLPIQNEATYAQVEASLDKTFAAQHIAGFLRELSRSRLRARQFEAILASGLFGAETSGLYASLGDSDRGHVREQYLSRVEQVDPALRTKFLKVYAYY